MRTHTLISLLVSVILAHEAFAAEFHGGRVVWWRGSFASDVGKGGTNGVVECDGEMLSNVVAVAANGGGALLLREDGEVFGWRTSLNEPCAPLAIDGQPLTNVVALSAYDGGAFAFQRDGTVVECDPWLRTAGVLPGLTNVTAVTKAPNNRLVALRRDGTVVYRVWLPGWEGFAKQLDSFPVKVVSVGGYPVTNVVALTARFRTPGGLSGPEA